MDAYIRQVVARLRAGAGRFTRDERNDFYHARIAVRLERLATAACARAVRRLRLHPLWSKEWFSCDRGFVFPNLRRYFALRRYESALKARVRADDEIWRKDLAYVTGRHPGATPQTRGRVQVEGHAQTAWLSQTADAGRPKGRRPAR